MIQDESHLLKTFPNEIWEKILKNMKDAKDYQNISSTSNYFRLHLYQRASQILFPEVVKLLIKEDSNPKVQHWIHKRGVCSAWKQGLDKILQTQDYFTQSEEERLSSIGGIAYKNGPLDMFYPVFSCADLYTKFETHFERTHLNSNANQLLRRKVELCIGHWVGSPESNLKACLQFLKKYGHHIWYCVLSPLLHVPADQIKFYNRKLKIILKRMPNLRALEIGSNSLEKDVAKALVPTTFPTLPHLEYISVDQVPVTIVHEIVRANPQLRYVDAINSEKNLKFFLESVPRLKELLVSISNTDDLATLKKAKFASRRECLWINASELRAMFCKGLFQTLKSQFSKSLKELHLSLHGCENFEDEYTKLGPETKLALPHLKRLFLEIELPQRLDFLVGMKETLEELHLSGSHKADLPCAWQKFPKEDEFNGRLFMYLCKLSIFLNVVGSKVLCTRLASRAL